MGGHVPAIVEHITDIIYVHTALVQCCGECLFLACSLLPSLGTIEEYAGQSCKDIRNATSNDCQQVPPSGPYYINTTDTCTGKKKTLKVCKEYHT